MIRSEESLIHRKSAGKQFVSSFADACASVKQSERAHCVDGLWVFPSVRSFAEREDAFQQRECFVHFAPGDEIGRVSAEKARQPAHRIDDFGMAGRE